MKTFTVIKHGYRKVGPCQYEVYGWTNDGDPRPAFLAIKATQMDALNYGQRYVNEMGRVAKYGVMGDHAVPILLGG